MEQEVLERLSDAYAGETFSVNAFGAQYTVELHAGQYVGGGISIQVWTAESEEGLIEPFARLTVNLDKPPMPGCVWMKNWSENAWVPEWLAAHPDWFVPTGRLAICGFETAEEWRLLDGHGRDITG